jgi:malonyl-CoA O-methyltransferase
MLNIQWSPDEYRKSAVVSQEASTELLSRLSWLTLKPAIILDVGCGTAETSAQLQDLYPAATVIALDADFSMLTAGGIGPALNKLQTDAEQLPIKTASVDMIFANFLLPWHLNLPILLREFRRVLRKEGVLLCTLLGLDTAKELAAGTKLVPQLVDMHDVGDLLLKEGFTDPVLDVDYCTLTYTNKEKLIAELKACGMLTAADSAELIQDALEITYEIIYAHAFVPEENQHADQDGNAYVPLAMLRQSLLDRNK